VIDLSTDFHQVSRILSAVPGYIAWQDTQARFLCANAVTITDLGFDCLDQMSGLLPGDVRCPAAALHDQAVTEIQYVLSRHETITTLFSAYITQGQWGLFLGQQQPLPDSRGVIIGVSTHTFDITRTTMGHRLLPLFLEHRKKGSTVIRQGVYKYLDSRQEWNLPTRQGECFFWLLQKKSAREIAALLDLSVRTIESYIDLIKHKFNVKTLNELIEVAHQKGIANYIPQHWYHPLR